MTARFDAPNHITALLLGVGIALLGIGWALTAWAEQVDGAMEVEW